MSSKFSVWTIVGLVLLLFASASVSMAQESTTVPVTVPVPVSYSLIWVVVGVLVVVIVALLIGIGTMTGKMAQLPKILIDGLVYAGAWGASKTPWKLDDQLIQAYADSEGRSVTFHADGSFTVGIPGTSMKAVAQTLYQPKPPSSDAYPDISRDQLDELISRYYPPTAASEVVPPQEVNSVVGSEATK